MNLLRALIFSLFLCITYWNASAAVPVFLYEGEPPYSLNFWNGSHIVIGGKTYFSGLEYQEQLATAPPSSKYRFNLTFNRDALMNPTPNYAQGDVVDFEGLNNYVYYFGFGIHRLVSYAGYRRVNNYLFPWQFDVGAGLGGTQPRIYVPRVYDIPVYLNAELGEEHYGSIWGMVMKIIEVENAVIAASLLATNARFEYSEYDNSGCATWYRTPTALIDYGVQKRVTNLTEWNKLKPGITLVDTITYCPGNTSVPAGALACAEVGGNRVILKLSAAGALLHNTLLHEIGHLMGLDHSTDFNNLMYYSVHSGRIKITQSQCTIFESPKVF